MTATSFGFGRYHNLPHCASIALAACAVACAGDDSSGASNGAAGDSSVSTGAGASTSIGSHAEIREIEIGGATAGSGHGDGGGGAESSGGAGGTSVTASGPLASVTVQVVGLRGTPVSAARVSLGGQSDETDADGVVVFTDVTTPYSAMVGAEGQAYVFTGLHSRAPVLHVTVAPDANRGAIAGTLSGLAAFATAPGARLQSDIVFAADADANFSSGSTADFTVQSRWLGSSSGTLRAIQYEYDTTGPLGGYPLNFLTYGETPADVDAEDVSLSLSPILQHRVEGTISMPAAAVPERVCLQLLFQDGANLQFERFSAEREAFTYQVPSISDAQARFVWYVTYPNSAEVNLIESVGGDTRLDLDVPLPLELAGPEDGANGVSVGTEFGLVDSEPGVHMIQLYSDTSWSAPRITLYLDGEALGLPDLQAVGLELPAGTDYRWTARALRGVGSVDELVEVADYGDGIGCGDPSPTRIRATVSGPARAFTTR